MPLRLHSEWYFQFRSLNTNRYLKVEIRKIMRLCNYAIVRFHVLELGRSAQHNFRLMIDMI